jgi:hypothetical protein
VRSPILLPLFVCLFAAASPCLAGEARVHSSTETVPVWVQAGVAGYEAIVAEVTTALKSVGYKPLICQATGQIPDDASSVILIAFPERLASMVSLDEPNLKDPESYLVLKVSDTRFVVVTAGGERGLLYGAQELAERINLHHEFPDIFPREARPFLPVRAFGIEWPESGPAGADFEDHKFVSSFISQLIHDRYNLLVLHYKGRAEELLEKSGVEGATASGRLQKVMDEAKRHLLNVALWLNPDADLETPLPEGDSPPARRNRWASSVAELAANFPDLEWGLWPKDENRERTAGHANQWFDGFIQILLARKENPPLLALSGAGFDPLLFQTEIAQYLPISPMVALKWCGDHPEACPEPQFIESGWLHQEPQSYHILWVLADKDVRSMRSAYYTRTRQIIRHMADEEHLPPPAGFLFFPKGEEIASETLNRESVENSIPWRWGFEKHWYRHALWGRLGFDPRLELADFEPFFASDYGPEAARALIEEETSGEEVLSRVSRFHWRYDDGDWYPEACLAPEEDGPYGILGNRTGPVYRDCGEESSPFESILEFAFSLTADPSELSFVEATGYKLAGIGQPEFLEHRRAPLEVAEILRRHGLQLEEIIERLDKLSKADPGHFEARHVAADLALQRLLGSYYRSKIMAAQTLMNALCLDSPELREIAAKEMEKGLSAWKTYAERADRLYRLPHGLPGSPENFSSLNAAAESDLSFIRRHPAFKRSVQKESVYGPFVKSSSELLAFEASVVRGGKEPPHPSLTLEVPSFTCDDPVEQGWLDILNHYAGFLALNHLPSAASGEVAWVPVPLPEGVNGFLRLRLAAGGIDEVVWGGRTVLDVHRDRGLDLAEGVRLAGPPEERTLWVRSNKPPHPKEGQKTGEWGFALAIQPDLPFILEPAWWESDGLVVRVRNQLERGRIGNIGFKVTPVGEGWVIPPADPAPLSVGRERTFLIPCQLDHHWAALRLEATWRKESVRLDFFPPLPYSNLTLAPRTAGALPRLTEGPLGWSISTAVRDWQNALLYRINEAYLRGEGAGTWTRQLTVEWLPGPHPASLVVEYATTRRGEVRREVAPVEGSNTWVTSEVDLPDLLESAGEEDSLVLRLSRLDHSDLKVREVSFE